MELAQDQRCSRQGQKFFRHRVQTSPGENPVSFPAGVKLPEREAYRSPISRAKV